MTAAAELNAASRAQALRDMQRGTLDLLVVGGGITGAGAALDAAARGLKVGLIEKDDLASGTSSKSSKMIHGGLRYLEQLRFGLVRDALRERALLLTRLAPHLVRPVPFLYPLRHHLWERPYIGSGVALYDAMGGARHLPRARHLGRAGTKRLAPALRPDRYMGGIQFWDAQVDDARYVLFVARTAAAHGLKLATRVRADDLIVEGDEVKGVRATDSETGAALEIRARQVVSATGPWTDSALAQALSAHLPLRPSKGIHIVLPRGAIDMETGLLARTPTGLLFVIPWQGHWLVGDTDSDWSGDPDAVHPDSDDVGELIHRLNSQLSPPITRDQIIGVFAGLRPLVASDPSADSTSVSREHEIRNPLPGLTIIGGGKFTTYRKMAADLIDAATRGFTGPVAPSPTDRIPLLGTEGYQDLLECREKLMADHGIEAGQLDDLLGRYGGCLPDVLSLMDGDGRPEAGSRLLKAETVYACRCEGALHLEDVVERRTRMAICQADGAAANLKEIAVTMQAELGWTDARTQEEIAKTVTRLQNQYSIR